MNEKKIYKRVYPRITVNNFLGINNTPKDSKKFLENVFARNKMGSLFPE
jgi:hypothetical protein